MRLDGTIRYRSFVGSITGKRFFILRKGDIVIMDNLSIQGVQELILSANALSLYFLRKWKIRNAVKAAIFKIVTSDCQGWFQHSGYCYYF